MLAILLVTTIVIFNINGLFSLTRKKYSEVFVGLFVAVINADIFTMAVSFFLREVSYSRTVLLLTAVLQFIMLATWKYIFWRIDHTFMKPRNVLVVGSQVECERIITRLQLNSYLHDRVKYICDNFWVEQWENIAKNINLVIICNDVNLQDKSEIVHFCHVQGKQVFIIPGYYELFCSNVDLDKIDDIPVFRPRYLKPTVEQRFLKRVLDLTISCTAIVILLPIFAIIAIAIKLDSKGPVFFKQVRSGRYRTEFKVYKFRTMRQDAEKNTGPVFASENDPRITKLGGFLRATRLDELPQFINVVIGNMSLVGPRPERPFFVEQFSKEIPEYVYRYNVHPGITGMAQIMGKYNSTPNDKLIYDLRYIQNCNILTDIIVMLQTLKVLLTKSSTEGAKATLLVKDLYKYKM
jgi:exopolysaccharide biosynthesis polyprenyl glycosylphosphotransferase